MCLNEGCESWLEALSCHLRHSFDTNLNEQIFHWTEPCKIQHDSHCSSFCATLSIFIAYNSRAPASNCVPMSGFDSLPRRFFTFFSSLLIAARDETWTWWIIDQHSSFLYRQKNKKKTDGEEISGTSWLTINSSRARDRAIQRTAKNKLRLSTIEIRWSSASFIIRAVRAYLKLEKHKYLNWRSRFLLLFVRCPRRGINASHASN